MPSNVIFLYVIYSLVQMEKVFVLLGLLRCDFTMEETVTIPVETCNRSSIPYEYYRYEILILHPHYIAV